MKCLVGSLIVIFAQIKEKKGIKVWMLLIAVHSNMYGIFQQQFSKCKVTMTTLCDEIEAGIATSFNCFIQCDFQGNQADFHDINNYSKGSEGNSFKYICLSQKLFCSEHLQASSVHTRPK